MELLLLIEAEQPPEPERYTTGLNRVGYANRFVSDSEWRPGKDSG
jgi:hypothetical protein